MLARSTRLTALLPLLLGCESTLGPEGLDHITLVGPPATAPFLVNDTFPLTVSGYTHSNEPYPAGPVTWTSSDPNVVAVTTSGQVVGVTVGTAQVTATVGNRSAAITLPVGGTRHQWDITASETWTRAGSPHVVWGNVLVAGTASNPATLTIEAGARVEFGSGTGLTFGLSGAASLDVQGAANAPVTFQTSGLPGGGAWIGLTFRGRTPSTLRYVTLSGCGTGRGDNEPRGCIVLGHPIFGGTGTILVDHVTIENASGGGLILLGKSRFAPGSTTLSVNNLHGYVAAFPANELAGFPAGGTFTANDTNEVRLTRDTLRESLTWPSGSGVLFALAEPWLIEGPHQPVLTIPAGATIAAWPGAALIVGKNAPGGLQVGSDGAAPVTFQAVNANGWGGIVFRSNALPSAIHNSVLDHCGTRSDDEWASACLNIVGNSFGGDPAPILTDVTIRNGTLGAVVASRGSFGAGSRNLTIIGMSSSGIRFDGSTPGSLPPGSYTGNVVDVITVWNTPEITRSETWRNVGLPYVITGAVAVKHSSNPILTIEPGVVIRFPPGGGLDVGQLVSGRIYAVGTATQPIVFTDQYDRPGSWGGVTVEPFADSSSVFDHVIVENAVNGFTLTRDIGPIISNTIVRGSSGCGINRLPGVTWTTDFTVPALGNSFAGNGGPDQCGP